MTKEELIKILEEYEVFVDDDYGGSYQSIIAYTKDKKISKSFTSLGTLKIINTFEKMQKENQQLKEQLQQQEEEYDRMFALWHSRKLIKKFDDEFDEEDKKQKI